MGHKNTRFDEFCVSVGGVFIFFGFKRVRSLRNGTMTIWIRRVMEEKREYQLVLALQVLSEAGCLHCI